MTTLRVNFQLRHLHLTYTTLAFGTFVGSDPVWVFPRFSASENQNACGVVLHDPTFRRFSRTLTCDRRTDGWTDRQTDTRRHLTPALYSVARVKIGDFRRESVSDRSHVYHWASSCTFAVMQCVARVCQRQMILVSGSKTPKIAHAFPNDHQIATDHSQIA